MKKVFRDLKYVTFNRSINLIRLFISFWVSRLIRKPVHRGKPFAVSVEPGTTCTLHCPECPTGAGVLHRPKGRMSLDMYRQLIEELSPELTVLNLYLQGEPFMHPHLPEMIKLASEKNIYTITSSNGQVFDRNLAEKLVDYGLSEIYFSLDGVTQKTYEMYRKGGNIEKVKNAIKTLASVKKQKGKDHPMIVVQFIVFRHNEHEVDDFKTLAGELGADKTEIKTAQFNDFSGNEVAPPENKQYRRYVDKNRLLLKGRTYNHCWKSWMSLVFTWDGSALPCCYDKDGEYSFGRYSQDNFDDLWNGKKNMKFRSLILQRKNEIKICSNCPEGRNFFF